MVRLLTKLAASCLCSVSFCIDIIIGFEKNNTVFEPGMFEVCLKYYNPPLLKVLEEENLRMSRYEILVDIESVDGSAGKFSNHNIIACSIHCSFQLKALLEVLLFVLLDVGLDYYPIAPMSVIFRDSFTSECVNIAIMDDEYLECTETFRIIITAFRLLPSSANFGDGTAIIVDKNYTEILIEDDDCESNILHLSLLFGLLVLLS